MSEMSGPGKTGSRHPLFWVGVLVACGLLVGGFALDGYEKGRLIGEAICLGCLGLDPESDEFDKFWVEYPDGHLDPETHRSNAGEPVAHPDIVLEGLETHDMVMLFFWYEGCVPCRYQWEDMVRDGLVAGEEGSGEMARYGDSVLLISFDILDPDHNPDGIDGNEMLFIYDADGVQPGAPVTVFIIELPDGNIGWWSHDGRMRDMGDIDEVIREGLGIDG